MSIDGNGLSWGLYEHESMMDGHDVTLHMRSNMRRIKLKRLSGPSPF